MFARRLLPVLAAAMVLAGCTADPAPSPAPTTRQTTTPAPATSAPVDPPTVGSLVTLGDSYTAGPGVGAAEGDSGFCLRSVGSWPTLLAELTSADLSDVSCSGATTANALTTTTGQLGRAAQLDAVTPDADVVTVQLGGNDGGLFQSLIQACVVDASTCSRFVEDSVPGVLATTTDSVTEVLDRARAAAPDATVLLVGYLRIAPESGTCSALGLPAADVAEVRSAEEGIEKALATAADRADVPFVSMREVSRGHDACAGDAAWTNAGSVPDGDGIGFHPRAAGMKAVADQVALAL